MSKSSRAFFRTKLEINRKECDQGNYFRFLEKVIMPTTETIINRNS